jgi:hypothetical protein
MKAGEEARELLRAFIAQEDATPIRDWDEDEYLALIEKARAHLSRTSGEKEDVGYAEGAATFPHSQTDGRWWVTVVGGARTPVQVRIPVPAHLLNPPVIEGEIVP